MAKQFQDVSGQPLCTTPQVQTMLQEKLDEMQKAWKAGVEIDTAQLGYNGASLQLAEEASPVQTKVVALLFDSLKDKLGDWMSDCMSAFESRLSDMEQVVWTATQLSADRQSLAPDGLQSESATVQRLYMAMSKLEGDIASVDKKNVEQRKDLQLLGARLHKEIEDINGSLRDILSTHLFNIEKHASQAFGDGPAEEVAVDCINTTVQRAQSPEAAAITCPMATVVQATSPSQHSKPQPGRLISNASNGSTRSACNLRQISSLGQQGGSYVPVASLLTSSLSKQPLAPAAQQLHGNWRYPQLSRPSSPTGGKAHASPIVMQGGQAPPRGLR